MLQIQQMTDAAIAVDMSLLIKCIPGLRFEPETSHTESRDSTSTTELLQNAIPFLTMQLYLKQTACKAALNKRLSSAASMHCITQLQLDATF